MESETKCEAVTVREVQEPVLAEKEEWRPIPEFEGWYEASNLGRVRTVSRIVPQHKAGGPYYKVSLSRRWCRRGEYKEDIRRQFEVHVLVAAAFNGVRPKGLVTDHMNADKEDNRAENLEYVTRGENVRRAWQLCEMSQPPHWFGEKHWKCKVSDVDRAEIKRRGLNGESSSKLAREFGVNSGTVWEIIHPRTRRRRNG